jgi:tRNA threonylcarbamoyladenosine biosynthesis protein TsaE
MTGDVTTRSEAETIAVGRQLGKGLDAGAVVLLSGDLGSGKTAFVRGLAEGLGIDSTQVTSPTFTLIQEYHGGRLPLYHADLYRLTPREVEDIGLEELANGGGVTAIEWPDRLPMRFEHPVFVHIDHRSKDVRTIAIEPSNGALLTRSGSWAPPW